jgi:transcription elongation GreA/GreB family factor
MTTLKREAVALLQHILTQRVQALTAALAELTESITTESKSSAGDKHETGRARMQAEQSKLQVQLQEARKMYDDLLKIPESRDVEDVRPGSLVVTSHGIFFLSVAAGKVTVDGRDIYAISPVSPIGRAMMKKKKSEEFEVNGKRYAVLEIG